MSFREISQPLASDIIRPVKTARDIAAAPLPHDGLFLAEAAAWSRTLKSLPAEAAIYPVGERLIGQCAELRMGQAAVMFGSIFGRLEGRAAQMAVEWYNEATVLMGYSRFLRNPAVLPLVTGLDGITGRINDDIYQDDGELSEQPLFMDFVENELDKTGLHVYKKHLDRIGLAQIEPGRERWYEGQDIYLRARRPAEPTVELLRVYRQQMGRRMDRVALTSLSARIKRHQWIGEE